MSEYQFPHKTVAEAVRVEVNTETDEVFLVFKISDPEFKRQIRTNWLNQDINLKIFGKKLIY
jgi:hypothetical protein